MARSGQGALKRESPRWLVLSGNTCRLGSGIHNTGQLTLSDSTVSGNEAVHCGGIFGVLTLIRSTINGNIAYIEGGGIRGSGTFVNSTLSGNVASSRAARLRPPFVIENAAGGGEFYALDRTTLTNMTITLNYSAANGGGVFSGGVYGNPSGKVWMKSTLLANNTAKARGPDCYSMFSSQGYDFVGHTVGCSSTFEAGDVTGIVDVSLDPKLGPLQNNGGATETHELLPGSRAIDAADDEAPLTDQRGIARPQGTHNDIGAFDRP